MKFGIFYELQLPKPWGPDDERQLVQDALAQVELADRLGLDYAWAVEHHFLEEYSHCSASDVFLAAAAARTKRIRLGHGIRQVIPNYNHPARTAEAIAMLDLVSNGRAELGIGEGATRLELGGFNIPAKEKRAMSLEAAEQIANMMVMTPYPGFEGRSFKMPCRNVIPKPVQKPHPPMWMACTNRDTIKIAASLGLGALAFSFLDEAEARTWSRDLLRHHQERRLRAARPQRQRQHRHGVGLLAARGRRGGRAARAGGLRVLPLRHLGARHQRCGARPLAAVRAVPGAAQRAARSGPTRPAPRPCRARSSSRAASARPPTSAPTCARSRRPASTRSSCCSRPAGTGTSTSARLSSCWRERCCPNSRPRPPSATAARPRSWRPTSSRALARKKVMPPLADADIPVVRAAVAKPVVNQQAS